MGGAAAETVKRDARENSLLILMLVCLLLSAGGIIWGICVGQAHIGQRGGALGVALSFFMLFVGRDTSKSLLNEEMPTTDPLPDDDHKAVATAPIIEDDATKAEIESLRADLKLAQFELDSARASISAMLDWGAKEKIFLSISSVTSTIVWGFGDCVARAFGAT